MCLQSRPVHIKHGSTCYLRIQTHLSNLILTKCSRFLAVGCWEVRDYKLRPHSSWTIRSLRANAIKSYQNWYDSMGPDQWSSRLGSAAGGKFVHVKLRYRIKRGSWSTYQLAQNTKSSLCSAPTGQPACPISLREAWNRSVFRCLWICGWHSEYVPQYPTTTLDNWATSTLSGICRSYAKSIAQAAC